jgi:LysR family hydrogen peroxide-inducible transcriptional activator
MLENRKFKLESGSFETLIQLSKEGFGYTLLPYLHTLILNREDQSNLIQFKAPKPAREISLIYAKNELKIQIINALYDSILGIIRGAIAFQDVKIISPKKRK